MDKNNFENIEEALGVIQVIPKNSDEWDFYRKACEYIIDHQSELKRKIYIHLPGGLGGNADSKWEKVKQGSRARCGCGNERVILPVNQRKEYEASAGGGISILPGCKIYLKPVGGDKESACVELEINNGSLEYLPDPFAPLVLSPDMFSVKGFSLKSIAEAMAANPDAKPIFYTHTDGDKTPIFAINSIDLESQTVVITPDKDVEFFDPEKLPDKHKCE